VNVSFIPAAAKPSPNTIRIRVSATGCSWRFAQSSAGEPIGCGLVIHDGDKLKRLRIRRGVEAGPYLRL